MIRFKQCNNPEGETLKPESELFDEIPTKNTIGRHKNVDEEGHIKRAKKRTLNRGIRREFSDIIKELLRDNNCERAYNICESLVTAAEGGDLKAFEAIRDLEKYDLETPQNNITPITVSINMLGDSEGVRDKE